TTLEWAARKLGELNREPGRDGDMSTTHYQFINTVGKNVIEDSNPLSPLSMWKPLKGPVRDWPLALCDNSTIDPTNDLQASDLVFADYVVENCQVYYTSKQKWYYIRDQQATEVWVFVQADSAKSARPGEFNRFG
ncbi:MAG: hypothetical protein Q9214_007626, partial [Letrouitia sp. 1 TL-2023]